LSKNEPSVFIKKVQIFVSRLTKYYQFLWTFSLFSRLWHRRR